MKSSSGDYFIALDHVRGMAAFIVFTWHFIHVRDGQLSPPPVFPLSVLSEGHTGVALFMTLSGYLFAKLIDGKRLDYGRFLLNRALRLLPLLLFVLALIGIEHYRQHGEISNYLRRVVQGVVMPSLPNGGWSITAEFHFYLIFPLLLFLSRRWRYSLVLAVFLAVCVRVVWQMHFGETQRIAYGTIVGRIDQFLLGMVAFQFRKTLVEHKGLLLAAMLSFLVFYWYFDWLGGFWLQLAYPSPSPIWIVVPTMEGLGYAAFICWYDNCVTHSDGPASRFLALIGAYSYSIYLLHFFFVFRLSRIVNDHVVDLGNLHVAMLLAVPCFLLMVPIATVTHRLIERPALRYRVKYTSTLREDLERAHAHKPRFGNP
jgi:peptidoglycan/LPS O-acetylase OafA/YrhL